MSEGKTERRCDCPEFQRSAIKAVVQECLNCGATITSPANIVPGVIAELESRIAEALEYCEDRQDIVDGENGPLPNLAMQVATILKGRVA